jgi:hypothetical protein
MTTSKEPYYFIASPYNGTDEEKQYRYKISKQVATDLLKNHISVFAPTSLVNPKYRCRVFSDLEMS